MITLSKRDGEAIAQSRYFQANKKRLFGYGGILLVIAIVLMAMSYTIVNPVWFYGVLVVCVAYLALLLLYTRGLNRFTKKFLEDNKEDILEGGHNG